MMGARYWFFEMICVKTGMREVFSIDVSLEVGVPVQNFDDGFSYYVVLDAF
jgi:hypothetical protein